MKAFETEMLAMLKEPLGNVRIYHPSLLAQGATIMEIERLNQLEILKQPWVPSLSPAHFMVQQADLKSAIAARGKV